MKRISMIIAATLTLALLVSTHSQTPQSSASGVTTAQAQTSQGTLLTPAMRQEYVGLVTLDSGEAAVRAWARKHKLEIVSLKGYNIQVINEEVPQALPDDVVFAQNCDPKECFKSSIEVVTNTKGQTIGYQHEDCRANKCKFVQINPGEKPPRYKRVCEGWICTPKEYRPK